MTSNGCFTRRLRSRCGGAQNSSMRSCKHSCAALFAVAGSAVFCAPIWAQTTERTPAQSKVVGKLSDARLDESSGLAASRRFAGFLWTHNDSGDKPRVFLLNAKGQTVFVVSFDKAQAHDYEDSAVAGKGDAAQVYVGDIGDNKSRRDDIQVYRFAENVLPKSVVDSNKTSSAIHSQTPNRNGSIEAKSATSSTRSDLQTAADAPQTTLTPQKMTLRYPDGAHDAETLMATADGFLIVVTKTVGVSQIFKTARPFAPDTTQTLVEVGRFQFGARGIFTRLTTGGDLSADEKQLVVRTYSAAYQWSLPSGKNAWRDVWKRAPEVWSLPSQPQGESICWALDGRSWFIGSEKENSQLWQIVPQKK